MDESNLPLAQQLAQAASAFEHRRTGHVPKSVNVVLSEDTLVITLRGALSPAETALEPGWRRRDAGALPPALCQRVRRPAAGDRADHRGGSVRGERGGRDG